VQADSAKGSIELIQLFASTSFVGRSDFGGRKSRTKISDPAGMRGDWLASNGI